MYAGIPGIWACWSDIKQSTQTRMKFVLSRDLNPGTNGRSHKELLYVLLHDP